MEKMKKRLIEAKKKKRFTTKFQLIVHQNKVKPGLQVRLQKTTTKRADH